MLTSRILVHSLLALCCVGFAHLTSLGAHAGPQIKVTKVEPPNWWSNMRLRRIELMLYGSFPPTTKITSDDNRLQIVGQYTRENGNRKSAYLFVEIELSADIPAGDYALTLRADNEAVTFHYRVKNRELDTDRHQGFDSSDTIYLITPDRFANGDRTNDSVPGMLDEFDPRQPGMRHGGDLRGIIERLRYLKDLGVTTVWLNPVLENKGKNSYHGYATTDLYRIDPRLGTNQTYRTFVREAHRHGLKVIFDHVSNHIGLEHTWVREPPTRAWFNGSEEDHLSNKHYLLSVTDPHATPQAVEQLKSFWFVDSMPDLNQRNPRVARYLTQNMIWWIEFAGLDGIREDTYPYADQTFLANWAKTIREEYPRLNIVGEIWATKPAYIARFQEKTILPRDFVTHLPTVMDFPLMNAMREFVRGDGKLRDVYEIYSQDFLYTDTDNLLVFLDNHDTPRAIFEAKGETKRVKLALAILLTSRGIPQMLYGTELGMLGGKSHVELRANFPGGFPGDERDATTQQGRTQSEEEMFRFTRKLLHLRKNQPALTEGRLVHCAPTWNDDTYKFVRVTEDETIVVVANGHDESRKVSLRELDDFLLTVDFEDLLTTKALQLKNLELTVEPLGLRILKMKR